MRVFKTPSIYKDRKAIIKSSKQMERHLKGIANHHRIDILLTISKGKVLTLEQIIDNLNANPKTIGEHTRRLYLAGLISKKYSGKYVNHSLTPYGKLFVDFVRSFSRYIY
jgi:predicted transcriptional regulator